MLYFWQMKAACVPLPAPGAPSKISLMVSSDGVGLGAGQGGVASRIARVLPAICRSPDKHG
eukprot:gene16333-21653_t